MTEGSSTYESLIRPIETRLIQTAWRILRDPDDARDAMQETLSRVWNRLHKIRKHPNPRALILRICANVSYDTLRKKIRRREQEGKPVDAEAIHNPPALPDQRLLESERRVAIRAAIADLPRNQAVAVSMRLIQGQSYETIGEVLKCSAVTARVHVARARAKLRQMLADLVRE